MQCHRYILAAVLTFQPTGYTSPHMLSCTNLPWLVQHYAVLHSSRAKDHVQLLLPLWNTCSLIMFVAVPVVQQLSSRIHVSVYWYDGYDSEASIHLPYTHGVLTDTVRSTGNTFLAGTTPRSVSCLHYTLSSVQSIMQLCSTAHAYIRMLVRVLAYPTPLTL